MLASIAIALSAESRSKAPLVINYSEIPKNDAEITPRDGLVHYVRLFGRARPDNAESSKAYEARLRNEDFEISSTYIQGKLKGGIHHCGLDVPCGENTERVCALEHVWSYSNQEAQEATTGLLLKTLAEQIEKGKKLFIIETLNPQVLLPTELERKRYSGREPMSERDFALEQKSLRNESGIIDRAKAAGFEVLDVIGVPYIQPNGWGSSIRPNHTNFKLTVIFDPNDLPPSIVGSKKDGYKLNGDFYASYMSTWAKTFEEPVGDAKDLAIQVASKFKGRTIKLGERGESIKASSTIMRLREQLFTRAITPAKFANGIRHAVEEEVILGLKPGEILTPGRGMKI